MKKIKYFFSFMVIVAMVLSFAGCQKAEVAPEENANSTDVSTETTPEATPEATPETTPEATLAGELTISGSTSVEKIGTSAAEEFMALNPDTTVTYEGIGSSAGIKNANDGVTILGTASRNLKEEEKAWGLKEVVIAYDGVAVITNPANEAIADLTLDQVKSIFKGEITNWSEVGGQDSEIVVVSREDGSGTRGAFEEIVGFEDELTSNAIIAEGNGNVQTTVAGNPQAIGYVSFSYVDDTVKPLTIESVEPTPEKVLAEEYKISRPFLVVYQEENLTDVAQAYIDFVLSDDGQAIVEEHHGIKIK